MDQDDRPVGEVLSRREVVQLLGASGLLLLPGGSEWLRAARANTSTPPACVVRPRQTEGPYFVDTGLHRSDIRSDPTTGALSAGTPFALAFAAARGHEFTSQVYFDDAFTDRVFAAAPYASRGPRAVRNDRDSIFRKEGGSQLIVQPTADGPGYTATFPIGLAIDG